MDASKSFVVVAFGIAAALSFWGGELSHSSYEPNHDALRTLRAGSHLLKLENILQRVRYKHQGRIIEIELKEIDQRYLYEVEVIDQQGHLWELFFDASNGELLQQSVEP